MAATRRLRVAERLRVWERGLRLDYTAQRAFHLEAKKAMKVLANALGLARGTYDITSNPGGYLLSGEVALHGEVLYVQVSSGFPGAEVLYRRCCGRKDDIGGVDHFAPVEVLDVPAALAEIIDHSLREPRVARVS